MSTEYDNGDDRQNRLDRMIAEFRDAQTRRLIRANDKAIAATVVKPTSATTSSVQRRRSHVDDNTK